ncbi:hypothetical protein DXG01_015085 [Tephrocybe rancida]|nr:hypothetical protein DXG01_015085 [Tephrocybe rancida]
MIFVNWTFIGRYVCDDDRRDRFRKDLRSTLFRPRELSETKWCGERGETCLDGSAIPSLKRSALAEGTHARVGGPTCEKPAEGRLLRFAGADVVGMSMVPEDVVAREEGLNVMVLNLVTNFVVVPDKYRSIRDEIEAKLAGKPMEIPVMQTVSHDEALAVAKEKAEVIKKLVESVVELILIIPGLLWSAVIRLGT